MKLPRSSLKLGHLLSRPEGSRLHSKPVPTPNSTVGTEATWGRRACVWSVRGRGGRPQRYLGSVCSPSRYSSGYMALRGCPGSAMPSGGDTGSIASSLLPRVDVLLGSGDLSGERGPAVVRAQRSLPRNDTGMCHSLRDPSPPCPAAELSCSPCGGPERAALPGLVGHTLWATCALCSSFFLYDLPSLDCRWTWPVGGSRPPLLPCARDLTIPPAVFLPSGLTHAAPPLSQGPPPTPESSWGGPRSQCAHVSAERLSTQLWPSPSSAQSQLCPLLAVPLELNGIASPYLSPFLGDTGTWPALAGLSRESWLTHDKGLAWCLEPKECSAPVSSPPPALWP